MATNIHILHIVQHILLMLCSSSHSGTTTNTASMDGDIRMCASVALWEPCVAGSGVWTELLFPS